MNITRYRGDTKPIRINFTRKNKAAVDVTGYQFTLSVSSLEDPDSADYVFQVAGQVDDAAAGKVIFPLTAEHADQVGEFYFDIEVTDTAGYIDTPVKGRMIFNQDITK